MTAPETVLVREMGCTEAEFARWLPGAARGAPIESAVVAGKLRHRVTVETGTVEILAQPCPPRRIAAIALPVLMVTFRFIDLDAEQRSRFMCYFDSYTRRGGG